MTYLIAFISSAFLGLAFYCYKKAVIDHCKEEQKERDLANPKVKTFYPDDYKADTEGYNQWQHYLNCKN